LAPVGFQALRARPAGTGGRGSRGIARARAACVVAPTTSRGPARHWQAMVAVLSMPVCGPGQPLLHALWRVVGLCVDAAHRIVTQARLQALQGWCRSSPVRRSWGSRLRLSVPALRGCKVRRRRCSAGAARCTCASCSANRRSQVLHVFGSRRCAAPAARGVRCPGGRRSPTGESNANAPRWRARSHTCNCATSGGAPDNKAGADSTPVPNSSAVSNASGSVTTRIDLGRAAIRTVQCSSSSAPKRRQDLRGARRAARPALWHPGAPARVGGPQQRSGCAVAGRRARRWTVRPAGSGCGPGPRARWHRVRGAWGQGAGGCASRRCTRASRPPNRRSLPRPPAPRLLRGAQPRE